LFSFTNITVLGNIQYVYLTVEIFQVVLVIFLIIQYGFLKIKNWAIGYMQFYSPKPIKKTEVA